MRRDTGKVRYGGLDKAEPGKFEVKCQNGNFFCIYLCQGIELTISVIFPILSRLH
jgi:hypothetical protein